MSHDELMVKINQRYWKMFNHNSQDQTEVGIEHRTLIQNQYFALRAVVELHKPTSTNDTIFCNVCWAISEEHNLRVMPVVYPCPTIQGIENELA